MEIPYRIARKIVVAVVGGTTIVIGILMLVLPGPGVLVLSLGLATLAIEFAFARRWLALLKQTARDTYDSFAGPRQSTAQHDDSHASASQCGREDGGPEPPRT